MPAERPNQAADWAQLPRDRRLSELAARFRSIGPAPDDEALTALSDRVAAQCSADAAELARRATGAGPHAESSQPTFWQRLFLAVFDEIDALRCMGRISDVDELYRVFAVCDRLRAFAESYLGERGADEALPAALHERASALTALAARTEPGRVLPPHEGLREHPVADETMLAAAASRRVAVDRVEAAIRGWEDALAGKAEPELRELGERMAVSRKEHKRLVAACDWGVGAGRISEAEAATIRAALGEFDKDNDGWGTDTSPAAKVAVTGILADLGGRFEESGSG